MKKTKIIVISFLLITFLAGCTSNLLCRIGGGKPELFGNGCVDSCESERSAAICSQAIKEGCDCGPDECWSGFKCEPN